VGYPDYLTDEPPENPSARVAVINVRNDAKVAASFENYSGPRRLVHRWWFPEGYKELTAGQFFGTVIDRNAWRNSVDYFLYRKLSTPIGGVYANVYFSDDIPFQAAR